MNYTKEFIYCEKYPKLKSECDCSDCHPERMMQKRKQRRAKQWFT